MKKILLASCLLISMNLMAQNEFYDVPPKETFNAFSFKTRGYINGNRLDSIDARFAVVQLWRGGICFDYGQNWKKFKELSITNNVGQVLEFETNTFAAALNFLFYNG